MNFEDKIKTFEDELALIFNEQIKEFTRLCLVASPDYFFENCPASTSGKYHPLDELGADGTILHTKKVVTVIYELCRALDCEQRRDEVISAAIIHDLRKQGMDRSGHTVKNHPYLAAELIDEVQAATGMLSDVSYNIIRNCVNYHYGLWSSDKSSKSLDNYTREELCLYLSDYIASKRQINVNYKR